jgi:hypothetical protein
MTARTSAPPGKRNGPGVGRPESVEQDEALAGGRSASTLLRPADETAEPCRLCPLPVCGYVDCRSRWSA